MKKGFLKLLRTSEAEFLMTRDPNAFRLLTIIAYRANLASEENGIGLKPGECFLGNPSSFCMSQKAYREAKKRLSKGNLAAFRGTNKGTIGRICNSVVYDINGIATGQPKGNPAVKKGPLTKNKNKITTPYIPLLLDILPVTVAVEFYDKELAKADEHPRQESFRKFLLWLLKEEELLPIFNLSALMSFNNFCKWFDDGYTGKELQEIILEMAEKPAAMNPDGSMYLKARNWVNRNRKREERR